MADSAKSPNLFERAILREGPRFLSLLDRQKMSPTAGSGDRTHWSWKFTDFDGTRFHEAACVMSYLLVTPLENSPYWNSPALLHWIELTLTRWTKRQHADGSFDEAYPYERSLAAVSFTSFYVSEALLLLGDRLAKDVKDAVVAALGRAGLWLERNDETHGFLSNHLAAAAAALEHIALVTGESRFRTRSRHFIEKILAHQSEEGWYLEYGGADPGYQTHGSFYLARIAELTNDQALRTSLDRASVFQSYFIHPDGSLGGEYTSRNTQTYYPAAFEMLAPHSGAASWIAETMRAHVATGHVADLAAVDQYNYFVFLNNFVFAARALREHALRAAKPIAPDLAVRHFEAAGLLRIQKERYVLFAGVKKGGVVKVFDRRSGRLAYSDCGYIGAVGKKKMCSTQSEGTSTLAKLSPDGFEVEGGVFAFSRPVMTPVKFALFRAFSMTVGRVRGLAYWLKALLVKVLITKKKDLGVFFVRRVTLGEKSLTVSDKLLANGPTDVRSLAFGQAFTTIHMGSSRYFVEHELSLDPAREAECPPIAPDELRRGAERSRTVEFGDR